MGYTLVMSEFESQPNKTEHVLDPSAFQKDLQKLGSTASSNDSLPKSGRQDRLTKRQLLTGIGATTLATAVGGGFDLSAKAHREPLLAGENEPTAKMAETLMQAGLLYASEVIGMTIMNDLAKKKLGEDAIQIGSKNIEFAAK